MVSQLKVIHFIVETFRDITKLGTHSRCAAFVKIIVILSFSSSFCLLKSTTINAFIRLTQITVREHLQVLLKSKDTQINSIVSQKISHAWFAITLASVNRF